MEKYDLCVIGGGPSGYAAAMRAIDFGKRVVLIEKDKIGGAGIYNGALSSKTLWELSEKVAGANDTIVSMGRKKFEISWVEVMKTLNEALFDRKFQYSLHIKLLQQESSKKLFSYERGMGSFKSKHEIAIGRGEKEKIIWAENTIIAVGSKPRLLPNIDADEETILTSDGIENLTNYPKSLVIVGAGVIGCEYATIFSNFGRTKVYLIDRADRILPFEDEDISEFVAASLEKKGVTIHRNAKLEHLTQKADHVEYKLSYPNGETEVIAVEKALLSVGRIPNTKNLGLENAGVKMNEKNSIYVDDDDTQTNVPNIYAVGDASGHIALVNIGEMEGRHAVEKIFGNNKERISYDNASTIMFLHPEVAAVGMNEQQCIEQGIPIKVVKLDFSCIARAIAMRKTEGFFKIIVTDDTEMKILGMRAIGEHASSAIQAVALLINMNKGIEELADLVHPHPSIIEGIQECVRMLLGKSVFKASVFKDKLQCYSRYKEELIPLDKL